MTKKEALAAHRALTKLLDSIASAESRAAIYRVMELLDNIIFK